MVARDTATNGGRPNLSTTWVRWFGTLVVGAFWKLRGPGIVGTIFGPSVHRGMPLYSEHLLLRTQLG